MPQIKTKGKPIKRDREWQIGDSSAGVSGKDVMAADAKPSRTRSGAERSMLRDSDKQYQGDYTAKPSDSGAYKDHWGQTDFDPNYVPEKFPDSKIEDQPDDYDKAYAIEKNRELPEDWTDEEADFIFTTTGVTREEAEIGGTNGLDLEGIMNKRMAGAMKADGKSDQEISKHLEGS